MLDVVMKAQIGNSELISQVNSRLVLQAVRVMQPTFRAEVARRTGLKPATVTVIVNNLLEQRMLQEVTGPVDEDRFGRPPLMLQVNPDVKHVLAIDLEPDRIRVALTNLLLQELAFRDELIDRFARPAEIIRKIVKLARETMKRTAHDKLLGVGLSLPGLIDSERGVLISSTNMPQWHDVPIADLLERELKVPVHVERSVRLAALYEEWSSPHLGEQTTLIVSLRTGVGFGLIHRGELYVGNSGFDGEVGHTVVDIDGPQCECGSRGCLETFISASAIVERARRGIDAGRGAELKRHVRKREPLTPELIYRLAREGDELSIEIVREVGRFLGIAIANLMNLLAPHEVVICGAIDMADELILNAVKEQVARSALPRTREKAIVRLAREKDKLPLLGAAVLVAQQVFALPRLSHAQATGRDDHAHAHVHSGALA